MRVFVPVRRPDVVPMPTAVGRKGAALTVGFMNNDLDPGLARGITASLGELVPGVDVRTWIKHNNGSPEAASRIDELAEVADLAVAGVGMCGSCTASVLMDAVQLWRRGVPTVAVVWDNFAATARAHAALHGVADLPIAVVPRLVVGQTDGDQEAKAAPAAEEIVASWRAFSALSKGAAGPQAEQVPA